MFMSFCPNKQKSESQINVYFGILTLLFLQSKGCGVGHFVKQKQQTWVYHADVQIFSLIFQNLIVEKFI